MCFSYIIILGFEKRMKMRKGKYSFDFHMNSVWGYSNKGLILHALHFNGWYYNFPLSGYSNQNETFFTEFFRDFHRLEGRDLSIQKNNVNISF